MERYERELYADLNRESSNLDDAVASKASLPMEVILLIIHELSLDDCTVSQQTYRSSRLLNRNINAAVTPSVFRSITLPPGSDELPSRIDSFLSSPHNLLQYVRHVNLHWTSAFPRSQLQQKSPTDYEINWPLAISSGELQSGGPTPRFFQLIPGMRKFFGAVETTLESVKLDAQALPLAEPDEDPNIRYRATHTLDHVLRVALDSLAFPRLRSVALVFACLIDSRSWSPSEPLPPVVPAQCHDLTPPWKGGAEHPLLRITNLDVTFKPDPCPPQFFARMREYEPRVTLNVPSPLKSLRDLRIDFGGRHVDLHTIMPSPEQRIAKLCLVDLYVEYTANLVQALDAFKHNLEEINLQNVTISSDEPGGGGRSIRGPWGRVFETLAGSEFDNVVKIRLKGLKGGDVKEKGFEHPVLEYMYNSWPTDYAAMENLRVVIAGRRERKGLERDKWLEGVERLGLNAGKVSFEEMAKMDIRGMLW